MLNTSGHESQSRALPRETQNSKAKIGLRRFVEQDPPVTQAERVVTRAAFRDMGLFASLNLQREDLGDPPFESVSEVTWPIMKKFAEEQMDQVAIALETSLKEQEARLAEKQVHEAEIAADAEARHFEGDRFKKFIPMSKGPEAARKWNKEVPFKMLPMNRIKTRPGSPTEMPPETYQNLQELRSRMIQEQTAQAILLRERRFASLWLRKKYKDTLLQQGETLEHLVLQALQGIRSRIIDPADVHLAQQATEKYLDSNMISSIRHDITFDVDQELGLLRVAREKTEKPKNWKKNKKTQH